MNIADLISTDFVAFEPDTPVSTLVGTFDDPSVKGVLVMNDSFDGVVTRRQLATTHHPPQTKLGTLAWSVPRLAPDEDVRRVAHLMVHSDVHLLPVFDDTDVIGVVTAADILVGVQPHLDAITVEDIYTPELTTVTIDTTLGQALRLFREQRITHLPVMDDTRPVGMVSLYDIIHLTVREEMRSQGGESTGEDPFGGSLADSAGRSRRGGFGAREGEMATVLGLPMEDVMERPVRTIALDEPVIEAVERMREHGGSSLLVTDGDRPTGIVTTTDILDALTWEAGGDRGVQIYGIDLLDGISHDDVVKMIDRFDDRDRAMRLLDARIHLQAHDETLRGQSLILARIRLFTDRGMFIAEGEGFGARQAINEARQRLERQIQDEKPANRRTLSRRSDKWEAQYGWMFEHLETESFNKETTDNRE